MSKATKIILNGQTIDIGSSASSDVEINYRDDTSLTVKHGNDQYVLRTMEKIVKPATPVITDPSNDGNKSVTITCATAGVTIYYTLDGTTPTAQSTRYTSAIALNQDTAHESYTKTVKAIAIKNGQESDVAGASITVYRQVATPTTSISGNKYSTSRNVTIACTTTGATIEYSTNGGTTWQTYSSAIAVTTDGTNIKARATKSEWKTSATAETGSIAVGSPKCYIGQAASLSYASDVKALANAYEQDTLVDSTKSVNFGSNTQYVWFCIPTGQTQINSISSDGFAVTLDSTTYTVGSWKCRRSLNKLNSSFNFKFV